MAECLAQWPRPMASPALSLHSRPSSLQCEGWKSAPLTRVRSDRDRQPLQSAAEAAHGRHGHRGARHQAGPHDGRGPGLRGLHGLGGAVSPGPGRRRTAPPLRNAVAPAGSTECAHLGPHGVCLGRISRLLDLMAGRQPQGSVNKPASRSGPVRSGLTLGCTAGPAGPQAALMPRAGACVLTPAHH